MRSLGSLFARVAPDGLGRRRRDRSVLRAIAPFAAVFAVVLVLGCVTTRPSAEPLGWGALPPGALTASHRAAAPKVAKTEAHAPPSDDQEKTASDAGGPQPEKSVAAPSGSASPASAALASAGAPPKSEAVASFVGEFAGEDVATYRISGLPDRTERDPKARIDVKTSEGGDLLFVLIDSSNGKDICTLSGTVKDSTANIGPGQKCFEQNEGEASTGATVTKGSATVEKKKLLFDLELDFEMTAEGRTLRGSLTYHFEGKRQ